jgi:hypothetical protein
MAWHSRRALRVETVVAAFAQQARAVAQMSLAVATLHAAKCSSSDSESSAG